MHATVEVAAYLWATLCCASAVKMYSPIKCLIISHLVVPYLLAMCRLIPSSQRGRRILKEGAETVIHPENP